MDKEVTLHRGLQGVYFDRSETTFIDGKEGVLEYRGYNINDLAELELFFKEEGIIASNRELYLPKFENN